VVFLILSLFGGGPEDNLAKVVVIETAAAAVGIFVGTLLGGSNSEPEDVPRRG